MIKSTRQIIQIGNSFGITLQKNLLKKENIVKGDFIEIIFIKKLK